MPMIDWQDRTDEGRAVLLRYVNGGDPWKALQRNRWRAAAVSVVAIVLGWAKLVGVPLWT
jgi:hypothetical protein